MRIEIQEFKARFKIVLIAEDGKESEELNRIKKKTKNENSPQNELHLVADKHPDSE